MNVRSSLVSSVLALLLPFVVAAQTVSPAASPVPLPPGVDLSQIDPSQLPLPPSLGAAPVESPAGAVNCFDYYQFGSVQVDVEADVTTAFAGTEAAFRGEIVNANQYPIVDGAVYVKIFRVDLAAEKNTAGPDVVDQFFVKKDVSLAAAEREPLEFTWAVPPDLLPGEYKLATFFTAADKYNLLGLSFTDDVVGNAVYFSVAGEAAGTVAFNKEAVTINGAAYHFAAFPPRLGSAEEVAVSADIANTTGTAQTVAVTWRLYAWDALTEDNLVDIKQEVVTVPAGGTAATALAVTDANHPVYYAVATVIQETAQSIIGVRFVREGVNRPRINFPAVSSYPLEEGKEATLFACVHGMGTEASLPNNKLVVALEDTSGRAFHTYTYEGDITGAMMGLRDVFTPDITRHRFTLAATLYHNNEIVDEARLDYDCADLSPDNCPAESAARSGSTVNLPSSWKLMAGALAALVIILIAVGLITSRRHRTTPPVLPPPS